MSELLTSWYLALRTAINGLAVHSRFPPLVSGDKTFYNRQAVLCLKWLIRNRETTVLAGIFLKQVGLGTSGTVVAQTRVVTTLQ